jgi:hypothetical protein
VQIAEGPSVQRRGDPLVQFPGCKPARGEIVAQQSSGAIPVGIGSPEAIIHGCICPSVLACTGHCALPSSLSRRAATVLVVRMRSTSSCSRRAPTGVSR